MQGFCHVFYGLRYVACAINIQHHLSQAAVCLPTFLLFANGLPSAIRTAKMDEKNN